MVKFLMDKTTSIDNILYNYKLIKTSALKNIVGGTVNQINLSKNLVCLREKGKLSRQELAYLLHVSQTTVARYEEGTRLPDIYMLCDIKNILNVTYNDLLN
jgi:DNA-binding transcriptional regulator YiaG